MLIIVLALLATAIMLLQNPDCQTRDCTFAQFKNHKVRQVSYWQAQMAAPLRSRVYAAPPDLIEYVELDNELNDFPAGVKPTENKQTIELVKQALAGIPAPIMSLFKDRLAGVFIVDNLGSSGYTDQLIQTNGKPYGGFILLDSAVFDKPANAWASWKESTAFSSVADTEIKVTLEDPADDSQVNAIQFILLHELAHVLAVGSDIHPDWWLSAIEVRLSDYEFASLSWVLDESGQSFESRFEAAFPLRPSLVYYREPGLSADQMEEVLHSLQKTNFVSPYAATSPAEDFAESFAIYVHSELMRKPYRIEVLNSGQSLNSMESCFADRCRDKLHLLEALLN